MTSRKTVTLVDAHTMQERLDILDDMATHTREKFYPLLLSHAGETLAYEGVVILLETAIYDYVQGLPSNMYNIMMNIMAGMAPLFVDAMIDDEQVAEEIKEKIRHVTAYM